MMNVMTSNSYTSLPQNLPSKSFDRQSSTQSTHKCIVLYSKYSSNSSKLLDFININVDVLSTVIEIITLCVDNEEIRKLILSSENINISVVPTLLIVLPSNIIEKYEGLSAFQWLQDVLLQTSTNIHTEESNKSSTFSTQRTNITSEIIDENNYKPNKANKTQSVKTLINIDEGEDEEDIRETPKQPKKQNKKQEKKVTQPNKKERATSIDDLVSESDEEYEINTNKSNNEDNNEMIEEDDNSMNESIKKRGATLRTGPNNYDNEVEFGETENQIQSVKRAIKDSGESATGKGNVMAAALAMQKSREKEDSGGSRKFGNRMN